MKFTLCKQYKHNISTKNVLAFEDSWLVLSYRLFFTKKSEFLSKMFVKGALCLIKRPITGKQNKYGQTQ